MVGKQMNSSCPVSEHILLLEFIPEDAPEWFQWDVNQACFSRPSQKAFDLSPQSGYHFLGFGLGFLRLGFCLFGWFVINILKEFKNTVRLKEKPSYI